MATNDYSKLVPFTDDSDKGDVRLDYQQNNNSSWFVRVSDRKETGVNYPSILLPLDGQTNGTIRILDQQVALGYTRLWGANKVIDARVGLSKTKAGKYSLSIGDNAITIPGLSHKSYGCGRPALYQHLGVYRVWPPEHEPTMAKPVFA